MEFIEGQTLQDRIGQEALSLKDSIRTALEIAEALENAHRAGIVHRDLKPANIMITSQGHTKVMDFGLAKRVLPGGGAADLSRTLTQASITERGSIAGTISYMSTEQARGENVDTRSDIFSLGVILYEMLTGKHPFSKSSPIETLTSILRDPVPPPHITPKSVNPVLNPILRRALAKNPADRYQAITELAAALRDAQVEKGFDRIPRRVMLFRRPPSWPLPWWSSGDEVPGPSEVSDQSVEAGQNRSLFSSPTSRIKRDASFEGFRAGFGIGLRALIHQDV
jgi:serine/threonine-protein kinase